MAKTIKTFALVFIVLATLFAVSRWQNEGDQAPETMTKLVNPKGCEKYHFRHFTHRSAPVFIFNSLQTAPDITIALSDKIGNPKVLSTPEIKSQMRRRNSLVGTKLKRLSSLLQHQSRSAIVGNRELKVLADNTVITGDVPSCTIKSIHFSHENVPHPGIAEAIEENMDALMDENDDEEINPVTEEDDISMVPDRYYRRRIPCDQKGKPYGCAHRIRKWDEIKNHPACRGATLVTEKDRDCEKYRNRDRIRSNLCNGKLYCVKFGGHYNRRKYQRGIIMEAGESWGKNSQNKQNYDCQGRCGPGCNHKRCSNWSRKCLLHDVCSWWYGARGGPFSWHCGRAFRIAGSDYMNCCLRFCRRRCKGPAKSRC